MKRLQRSRSTVRKLLFGLLCAGLLSFGLACNNDEEDGDQDTGMMEEDTGEMDPDTDDGEDDTGVDTGMDTGMDTGQPDTAEDTGGEMDADMGTGPTANVYVIHSSPDSAAETVDVWANGNRAVDDLEYGFGVPFAELPAGDTTIAITASDASDASDPLLEKTVTLEEDSNYIATATGVADPSNAVDNPDGEDIALDLKVKGSAKTEAGNSDEADILAFHAVTDAPAVDLRVNAAADPQVTDLTYGNYTGEYLSVPSNAPATIDVETQIQVSGQTQTVLLDSFQTPNPTGGEAWVVVAEGFRSIEDNPTNVNQFGLRAYPADASGKTEGIELDKAARVQAVHTAPESELDPAAVFLNGQPAGNIGYEEATPFISVPAGIDHDIAIGPASGGPGDAEASKTVNLSNGEAVVFVAAGVTKTSGWTGPQGNTLSSPNFQLVQGETKHLENISNVGANTFHGVFDAPPVDICTQGGTELASNLSFGTFSGAKTPPPSDYTIEVSQAGPNTATCDGTVVSTFQVDLSMAGGTYTTNVASGFLNPGGQDGDDMSDNSDSAFKLLGVAPNGDVQKATPSTP